MTQKKPKAELVIQRGRELGRAFLIRVGQRFSVGRAVDCAISLNDSQVSRYHAHLELTKHGLIVYDLDSRNGTYVDGRRIEGSTTIQKGVIRFGDHLLSAKTEDLSQDSPAPSMEKTRRIPRNFLPPEEFELLGIIGQGATGVVYAAHQKSLERNVAVKFPRTNVADYEDCRARFIREGRLCCKIESPYVVSVFDMRLEGNRVFIVMELINGGSVYDRLATSIMPIDEVARIGEHVASALACIHRMGIIHRDIKPANILLTPSGVAKLADFGIAKALGDKSSQTRLTGSDEGLGTLGYVSPEGAACGELSPLSDIYTLGATLYHMVTNRAPFVAPRTSVESTISRILHDDPEPILGLRPDCPKELETLISSMMAKDPQARPADCYVVAARLEHIKRKYSSTYSRLLPQTSEFSLEDFQTDKLS